MIDARRQRRWAETRDLAIATAAAMSGGKAIDEALPRPERLSHPTDSEYESEIWWETS